MFVKLWKQGEGAGGGRCVDIMIILSISWEEGVKQDPRVVGKMQFLSPTESNHSNMCN